LELRQATGDKTWYLSDVCICAVKALINSQLLLTFMFIMKSIWARIMRNTNLIAEN